MYKSEYDITLADLIKDEKYTLYLEKHLWYSISFSLAYLKIVFNYILRYYFSSTVDLTNKMPNLIDGGLKILSVADFIICINKTKKSYDFYFG